MGILRKILDKFFTLQYVSPGIFVGNQYFQTLMRLACFLCVWPLKWDHKKHRLVKETRLFKKVLRLALFILMYGISINGFYQYFYAEEYEGEPLFPREGDQIMHMNFLFTVGLGVYAHASINFGDSTLTDFLGFLMEFDERNDGWVLDK